MKKILAIIPARGGSLTLKNKNIKLFCGKPLIYYAIKNALMSKYIDKVIVSTNSKKIAKIALKYGAEVPFFRPKKLSGNKAKIIDAFQFTIKKLRTEYDTNHFISLAPTSPLTEVEDINRSIEQYFKKKAKTLISVVKVDKPIEWYLEKKRNNRITPFIKKKFKTNRQDTKQLYIPNGAIYIFNSNHLIKNKTYFNNLTYSYVMPKVKSIDIDDQIDFQIAENLYRKTKVR